MSSCFLLQAPIPPPAFCAYLPDMQLLPSFPTSEVLPGFCLVHRAFGILCNICFLIYVGPFGEQADSVLLCFEDL